MKRVSVFDVIIDRLTRSIEEVATSTRHDTAMLPISKNDLKMITKRNGWRFDWRKEYKSEEKVVVMKLVIAADPLTIHGLISFRRKEGFYFISLIESAAFNIGKNKRYYGVAGNMVGYVCRESFKDGFNGVVSFKPKTMLIEHYERSLGAIMITKTNMAILPEQARFLVHLYYKNSP